MAENGEPYVDECPMKRNLAKIHLAVCQHRCPHYNGIETYKGKKGLQYPCEEAHKRQEELMLAGHTHSFIIINGKAYPAPTDGDHT